ncbi:MAG TPA: hypothetical protein VGR59_16680 [Gemmatimonadaceae bacterium]|nr:hypothetical protein [Gemmatimonadaceae bacterium]
MISSFLTDQDVEAMALEPQARVNIGRCDRVASAGPSVRTVTDELVGSTTTDTGGNAP